jgi:membrane protein
MAAPWYRRIYTIPKRTILAFITEDWASQAAALAYYAVFSLPPLLFISVSVAALVFPRSSVVGTIFIEINNTLGRNAAQMVVEALTSAQKTTSRGGLEAFISIAVLTFTATGAFSQLQASLNRIWEVKPDPRQGEIRLFLVKRIWSFGMVVSLGFLLTVSLMFSAALTAFGGFIQGYLPSNISATFLLGLNAVVSLVVFAILFACIFKVLPDAHLRWKDVALGGLITSFLFSVGRALLGFYLAHSDVTTAYGAAASLALILLWTYYASITILLGAGLTRSMAVEDGKKPQPEQGAIRVIQREIPLT